MDLMVYVARLKTMVTDIFYNISVVYYEKGLEPFKKPALYSLPALMIAYFFIYSPTMTSLRIKRAELGKLDLISANYESYRNSKALLDEYKRRLPLLKDKDEWLNYILTSTAKRYDIPLQSLSAQNEVEVAGFIVVSRDVTVATTYSKFGKWVADIENSPILVRISEANFKRDDTRPGYIDVNLKISTLFPARQGGS